MSSVSRFCRIFCLLALLILPAGGMTPASAADPAAGLPGDSARDGEPQIVTRVEVRLTGSRDASEDADEIRQARSLIGIAENDPFAEKTFDRSLEALRLSRRFRAVNGRADKDGGRVTLRYYLTPARLIGEIRVSGAYPFFKRELINRMSVYEGDMYDPAEIPAQIPVLEEMFRKEGYPDARVSIHEIEVRQKRMIRLEVEIEKGRYDRLESMEFTGNRYLSSGMLRLRCAAWRRHFLPREQGRFSPRRFQEDLDALLELYREKGFADAVLSQEVTRNKAGRLRVRVRVDEGARYRYRFEGNNTLSKRHLKKDLVVQNRGNVRDTGIRRSVRKMRDRYLEKGFASVRITPVSEITEKNGIRHRQVTFRIVEGPRTQIRAIEITGNRAIPAKDLLGAMTLREKGLFVKGDFQEQKLNTDVDVLEGLYRKKGYVNIRITPEVVLSDDQKEAAIRLTVVEQAPVTVGTVRVTGQTVLEEAEAVQLLVMQPGDPFREYLVDGDANILSARVAEAGYPHVQVKPEVTGAEQTVRNIHYHVETGPRVTLAGVEISGNFTTRSSYIRDELRLETGKPFSLSDVLEGQRRLRDLSVFQSVRVTPLGLKERDSDVRLFVDVEEVKPRYLETGFGYDASRGFYVQGKGGNRNLWGVNREAFISGDWEETGYRLETGGVEPRMWGTKTSLTASVFMEKNEAFNTDFGTRVKGASVNMTRHPGRHWNWGTGVQWEYRNLYERKGAASSEDYDPEDYLPRHSWLVTPDILYDSRDSVIHPTRGLMGGFSVDVSSSINRATDNFIKYRFDARAYHALGRRLVFAVRGRWGYIQDTGTEGSLSDDQLFYLGGLGDVRGYAENMLRYDTDGDPVGGRLFASGNMEGRFRMNRYLELTVFADTGSLLESSDELDYIHFRHGVGLGLGYQTPIGPIGIYYGRKIDPKPDESRDRFHFFLGYVF